jgi:hypothetical protein
VQASELQLESGRGYGQHAEALRHAVPPSLLITPAASPHAHDSQELAWDDWLELEDAIVPPVNAWAYHNPYSIDTHGKIGMFYPMFSSPVTPVKTPKRDVGGITVECLNQSKKARPALDVQVPGTPGTLLAGAVSQLHVRSPVSHGTLCGSRTWSLWRVLWSSRRVFCGAWHTRSGPVVTRLTSSS